MEDASFLLLFFILLSSNLASARFTVIGPEQPIIAEVGKDIIFGCHISITAELREVRWFRIQSNYPYIINLYENGKVQPTCELQEYVGRLELMKESITHGNVALKIHNISIDDEGIYRCYLETDTYFESEQFELRVTATGSDPSIRVEVLQDGGIKMMCLSTGWYPEPKLLNKKDDGQMATGDISEIKVQQKDDYFSIEYSQVITQISNEPFTCVVGTILSSQEKESSLYVSESWFKKTSLLRRTELSFIVVGCTCVFLIIVVFAIHCWYIKKCQKCSDEETTKQDMEVLGNKQASLKVKLLDGNKQYEDDLARVTRENEQLKSDVGALSEQLAEVKAAEGPARFSRVDIALDSETAHPAVLLSDDRKTMTYRSTKEPVADGDAKGTTPCVLGTEGFTQGRHYWEVEVQTTGGRGWAIGLARESSKGTKEIKIQPQEGIWAVGMVVNEYHAFENPLTSLKLDPAPQRIRVYLDYEGQLAFYNAVNMCHIFTFLASFKEKVYPFFLTFDSQTRISL